MSKFDGTKMECCNRSEPKCGEFPVCGLDSLPCRPIDVCRHRENTPSEMTNSEIASSIMTEEDIECLRRICEETSARISEMSDPSTKMINDGRCEKSPLELVEKSARLESELDKLKAKIRELSDMSVFDSEMENEVSAVDAEPSEDDVELRHTEDSKNIKNSVLVTEADFYRISSALDSSKTIGEWISKIRDITGIEANSGMHIAKCTPTERTIGELFELKRKSE